MEEENEMENETVEKQRMKRAIGPEVFVFLVVFIGFFAMFAFKMGLANMLNTLMNTAYALLIDTVFYITAICVMMGAVAALLSEFGVVTLVNKLLQPLMKPVWGLPGASSLAVITTFLSDNPAVLSLADDPYYRHFFKKYQFPALTNLGTAFGMGLIVCTYMLSQSSEKYGSFAMPVAIGLLGAVVGSIISTRIMLSFTKKIYGTTESMDNTMETESGSEEYRPIRGGSVAARVLNAVLGGGASGVKMGVAIVPGVLIICTLVMMLTNGSTDGAYTGAAYEGIGLLPFIANKLSFILKPLFGFTSAECISVPITALGAAGAAIGLVPSLLTSGQAGPNDIAVFTAMCMCWSGYLSTHVSMMDSLKCEHLTGKAIVSHTIGGALAGVFAHYAFLLVSLL